MEEIRDFHQPFLNLTTGFPVNPWLKAIPQRQTKRTLDRLASKKWRDVSANPGQKMALGYNKRVRENKEFG